MRPPKVRGKSDLSYLPRNMENVENPDFLTICPNPARRGTERKSTGSACSVTNYFYLNLLNCLFFTLTSNNPGKDAGAHAPPSPEPKPPAFVGDSARTGN